METKTGADYVAALQEITLPQSDVAAGVAAAGAAARRVLRLGATLALDVEMPATTAFLFSDEAPDDRG